MGKQRDEVWIVGTGTEFSCRFLIKNREDDAVSQRYAD